MMDDLNGLLDSLPPEVLQQLMGLGGIDEQQALLQQQMQQAEALRQPGQERSTPMGALFGGLGDVVGNVGGAYGQGKAMKGMEANNAKRTEARNAYVQALRDYMRKQQGMQQQQPPPTMRGLLAPGGGM